MGGRRGTGGQTMSGAVLVAVLAVAGCTSGGSASPASTAAGSAGPAPAEGFQPGAAGVGDPYYPTYGNGGYDVANYRLKLRYDPAGNQLTGQATITATATANLSRFDLDFAGLTVSSITVNGKPATNTRDQNELRVTPASGLRSGSTFTTVVDYGGAPQQVDPNLGVGGFLYTKAGAVAVGQPESATAWFPVNDHPSDKATYQVEITVPEGLSAISNGVPQGHTTAAGWTTWKWTEQAPMASYLATLAIGKYRVTTSQHDGKPVVTAVASALPVGSADQAMARTTEIADFLATQFGPYPFDAYGGIVVADDRIGYALETQTRPVYGPAFFRSSDATWVVAHELAHQWYGDSVALERWQDIWLNEGFASYAEWLWTEHTGGDSVQQSFRSAYASASDEVWRTPPGAPGVTKLFSASVYKRGAMTLQALRLTVGDEVFFRIIKEWAAEKRNGNGATAQFITLAEKLSGKSLRAMFNAWLYEKTQPDLPTS